MVPVFDKPYLQFHLTAESSFTVIGLSRKNQLPTLIALKSDNGWYLRHVGTWLKFDTHDIKNEGVAYSVHTNDDGTVLIMTDKGGFWSRRSSDWVSADGTLANSKDQNPDMVFKVITGDGLIALQNMGNHKFCNRLNYEGISYLSASADTKSIWTWFVLEEPIIHREIFDFIFHLDEARIYKNEIIVVGTHQQTNDTTSEQTCTFSFTAKKEVVTTWETVVSFNTSIDKMLASHVSKIPTIVGGEVTLSHKPDGDSEEITVTQNYTVPPGKTVTAKFVTMRGSCDVPYSYSQKDVLTNREEVTTFHEDGIYTCVNTYNLPITVTES
uniref:Uncharacterized protein n=2 Tax=Avena sativa TaxID=4498 RepID=A0ACD5Z9L4_AVESA